MLRNFILQLVVSKIRKKVRKKKLPSKIGFWEHFWGLVGVGFCHLAWSFTWWNPRSAEGGIALGVGVQLLSGSGGCFQKSIINSPSKTFDCYPVQK